MTDIEQKALALLQDCGFHGGYIDRKWNENYEALCRAIEHHEAFKLEVSDAAEEVAKALGTAHPTWAYLRRFIITKPDPLVEAMNEALLSEQDMGAQELADNFRAALAARGLTITETKE